MDTIHVEVLNPASLTLLEELEKLQFIAIHKGKKGHHAGYDFISLVQKIRSKSRDLPSMEEITAEVEQQRSEMYAISSEKNKGHH